MIRLHQFGPSWGLPNASPFCVKLEVFLALAGLEYEVVSERSPRNSPTGKLPYIVDEDGKLVPDSSLAIRHLEATRGIDLDADLSAATRAHGTALGRMLEDHLYWVLVYSRWVDPAGFEVMRKVFRGIPFPVRPGVEWMVRRNVRAQLHGQGLGRHAPADVYALGIEDVDALAAILDDGTEFLAGPAPSRVDCIGFGTVMNLIWTPIPTPLQEAARARPALDAYARRMWERVFPDRDLPRGARAA